MMSAALRTFISIPVGRLTAAPAELHPDSLSAELRHMLRVLNECGRSLTVVTWQSLHLTLKFLGETDRERLPQIEEAIQQSIGDVTSFSLVLRGLGVFPNRQRPSVVWAGVSDKGQCECLAHRLDQALEPLGFPPETRRFQPHVTLGRLRTRPPAGLIPLLDQHAETPLGRLDVRCVQLLQSELSPSGPRYSALTTIPLSSDPNAFSDPTGSSDPTGR